MASGSGDNLRRLDGGVWKQVTQLFARLSDPDLGRTYLVPKLPPW